MAQRSTAPPQHALPSRTEGSLSGGRLRPELPDAMPYPRMKIVIMLLCFTIVSMFCFQDATAQSIEGEAIPPRPNIIVFLVDDMGWTDTSIPFHTETTELNRRYQTPHMARLSSQGVMFTQAYANSVCSPSRVGLMTGMNAARHGVTNWTLHKDRSPDSDHPRIQPPDWPLNGLAPVPGIDRTVVGKSLPELLSNAGYRTIHVGKAHFGANGTPGADPINIGFDVNIAGHAAGGPGSYLGEHNFSAAWRNGSRVWDVPGLEDYHGQDIHLTEALTREAIKALDDAVEDTQPFFLYMSHYAIHAPWEADSRFLPHYLEQRLSGMPAVYASMIAGMDKSLGDLLDWLAERDLDENTLVVFLSDNGAPSQAPRNLPLRGSKLRPYEGGTRVPMIVRWPGHAEPGTRNSSQVIIEDLFPSILEAAGVELGELPQVIDGQSFLPLLGSERNEAEARELLWHFPHNYDGPPWSSVRVGDWKLIWFYDGQRAELYNLKTDLGEATNLAEQNPRELAELSSSMNRLLAERGALLPIDKRTGEPFGLPTVAQGGEAALEADPDDSLDLAARVRPLDDASFFRDPNWHHWGASILQAEDGQWHMFYARWPHHDGAEQGFSDWLWTCEIAHAVADRLDGPWTHQGTVLEAGRPGHWDSLSAHNPRIREIDGRFYIYYISHGEFEALPAPTARTRQHANWGIARNSQFTGVAVANHIEGPYTRQDEPLLVGDGPLVHLAVNPTMIARPDGQYQLIVKGDNPEGGLRIYGQAISDSPLGPFVWQPQVIATGFNTEDPDAWYDAERKLYYALVTRAENPNGDSLALITSADGFDWRLSDHSSVLGHNLPLADGGSLHTRRIERPSIILDRDGQAVGLTATLHSARDRNWPTSTTLILPFE
ncbi:MAG: arylsulfatase A-like enzyme [Candidatus Paceibacteria bacterium]|jgi:arylsulfatase A-like enzyme